MRQAGFLRHNWNFDRVCGLKGIISGRQTNAVTRLSRIQKILLGVLVGLLAISAEAQKSAAPSTGFADSRTLKVQRKVNDLFERGEYERAYFIYRNELVPLGDKYAQYMVGFMHLTGKGVEEDPVAASAWYRLAAERGLPEFIAVRDSLLIGMTPEERGQSDELFLEIRSEYSDLVVLLNSIKRGVREMKPMTGSRLPGQSRSIIVVEARSPNQSQSGTEFRRRITKNLERQLVMLAELGDFPDMETDPSRVDIDDVEQLVNERLQMTLDTPTPDQSTLD